MRSWNYEAGQIKFDNNKNFDDIVTNDKISDFLNIDKEYEKFFIIAPKGLGKTLLLKILSKRYRDNKIGLKFIPQNELCEKVGISMISIKKEDYSSFNEQNFWKDIWKFTISIAVAKRLDIPLSENIDRIFKHNYDISTILDTILLDYKYFLFKNKSILSKELIPIIRSIQQPVVIFIDSFDQAVEELFKYQNFDFSDTNQKKISFELWANSQLGLMYAINEFCQQQSHLKVFTAIREEAYSFDKSNIHLQVSDFVCKINYTKRELEEIFIKNINKTEKQKLIFPNSENPYIKFLGITELPHAIVNNKENIFDFIYRHTFGRPRELVLIGARLSEIPISERNSNQIRNVVNKASNEEIFKQFRQEIIPYFDENEFKNNFLHLLKENVFSRIESEILPEYLFKYYYELGLVGSLAKNHSEDKFYQNFELTYNKSINSGNTIPFSEYYFLHPATDKYFMDLGGKYNRTNIIGYDYRFMLPTMSKKTHSAFAHFGVGKLGIGLIIPLLTHISKKVIIINRYNENWKKMCSNEYINFINTNVNPITFEFLNDDTPSDLQLKIIEEWHSSEHFHLFLSTNNLSLIKSLIKDVNHISFSLKNVSGIEWFKSILQGDLNEHKTIYPFENNKDIVNSFYNGLVCQKSYIISDRICTSIDFNCNMGNVYCISEPFGQIALYSENKNNLISSTESKNIEIINCDSKEVFEFYYKRKFRLFNCIHAVIAIYCYSKVSQQRIPFSDWQKQYINLLQDRPEIKYKTELIVKGEILRLINETSGEILDKVYAYHHRKDVFNDLLMYSNNILDRISNIPDTLERVLPINDFTKKYKERIKSLYDFYDNQVNYDKIKSSNLLTNENEYREIRKNLNHLYQQVVELVTDILEQRKTN